MFHLTARSFLFSAIVFQCLLGVGSSVFMCRCACTTLSCHTWLTARDTSNYPQCISDPMAALFWECQWRPSSKARPVIVEAVCADITRMGALSINQPKRTIRAGDRTRVRSDFYSEAVGKRPLEEIRERGKERASEEHKVTQKGKVVEEVWL